MPIDRFDPTAYYLQVAGGIVAAIRSGDLEPADPIPSETQLVIENGVSRDTARRATKYLRDQGWIITMPKRGSFVAPPDRWPVMEDGDVQE